MKITIFLSLIPVLAGLLFSFSNLDNNPQIKIKTQHNLSEDNKIVNVRLDSLSSHGAVWLFSTNWNIVKIQIREGSHTTNCDDKYGVGTYTLRKGQILRVRTDSWSICWRRERNPGRSSEGWGFWNPRSNPFKDGREVKQYVQ